MEKKELGEILSAGCMDRMELGDIHIDVSTVERIGIRRGIFLYDRKSWN